MNKRKVLSKNVNCFLRQSVAENILPRSQSRKENRKKRILAKSGHSKIDEKRLLAEQSSVSPSVSRFSKLNKMREAELEIIAGFLDKQTGFLSKDEQQLKIGSFKSNEISQSFTSTPSIARSEKLEKITLKCSQKVQKDSTTSVSSIKLCEERTPSDPFSLSKYKASTIQRDALLLLSMEQIRNVIVSKRVERQTRSELKNKMLEARKIRFIYGGLSHQQLGKSVRKAQQLLGNASDNLLVLLESRLDVVLERCGFYPSVQAARQSIAHRRVYVNSRVVDKPGCCLSSGDIIQVKPSKKLSKQDTKVQNRATLQSYPSANTKKNAPFGEKEIVTPLFVLDSLLHLESFLFVFGWRGKLFGSLALALKNLPSAIGTSRDFLEHFFPKKQINSLISQIVQTVQNSELLLSQQELSKQNLLMLASFGLHCKARHSRANASFAKTLSTSTRQGTVRKQGINFKKNTIVNSYCSSKEGLLANASLQASASEACKHALPHKQEDKPQLSPFTAAIAHRAGNPSFVSQQPTLKNEAHRLNRSLPCKTLEKRLSDANIEEQHEKFSEKKETVTSSLYSNKDFYSTYCYWLEVKKRLLMLSVTDASFIYKQKRSEFQKGINKTIAKVPRGEARVGTLFPTDSHSNAWQSQQISLKDPKSFQERKSKPLHVELSYQSYTAIFLYAPQRVYLPALINLDLLVKI